ncbi:Protein CBG14404 [Caenorhabditis briggsae]|uniref:Protein CBG14404 n=2 Tax=Caenorhabditis briggsae TaxID=6238 RepID=A8XJX4_CAEBR|nr:Protein CBG14404 [Caenorhabditis briggsae]ULT82065.1 hypothetical protein L3Y34_011787 [Caenorhabditis briggsae]CAP32950.1 Protein CBG14404 [Caenorhabditis briggsae]
MVLVVSVILLTMTQQIMSEYHDAFALFEADASFIPSQHQESPFFHENQGTIETRVTLSPWIPVSTLPSTTTASEQFLITPKLLQIVSQTEKPLAQGSMDELGTNDTSHNYALVGLVFVIFMLLLLITLSNINSDWFRRVNTEKFRHIEMVVDNGSDSIAVLEIPTYEIDTSKVFWLPGYKKQLSVVREVSQEIDF